MKRCAWFVLVALAACSKRADPPSPARAAESAPPPPTPAITGDPSASPPLPSTTTCAEGEGFRIFVAPRAPAAGVPLRIMAVGARPLDGALVLEAPDKSRAASAGERRGGPPYWWYAELPSPTAGAYRVLLRRAPEGSGEVIACREVEVASEAPAASPRTWGMAWRAESEWDAGYEDLYSAWIERLFDAPLDERPSWSALHDVLRDRDRNFLHDYLGSGEDSGQPLGTRPARGQDRLALVPDCADLPYFLRAYFAFKMGLPFGYSSCTRGGGGRAPVCTKWHSNHDAHKARRSPAATFNDFARVTLADTVHSGAGRVDAEEDTGDYYPVKLSWESLRPGTIYADPYGHVLVVASRVPQSEERAGLLFAVDGQPDGTVARRRFWRGNFLFALDPGLGSAGFKRFRPVVTTKGKGLRALSNGEIKDRATWGDYSIEQYGVGVDGFYDRMDRVLSPAPQRPERALGEAIAALDEQVRGRIVSVDNAKKHFAAGGGEIEMPKGASIFETDGPWEDFSTPSRDLRLLIAIDIVRGFPERVAKRPDRFAMPKEKAVSAVKAELEAMLDKELRQKTFSYERSDGSRFSLSLADVMARAEDLEMAYNPNDCPELRWAAPKDSEEASTCRRHAPPGQRSWMRRYRRWFHERKRPPRE